MQEENQNFTDYFERTRVLAEKLGIAVVDLPEHIGVSKAMLFAYRKGKYPISWKAWRRLEAAENAAGITAQAIKAAAAYEDTQPAETDLVREDEAECTQMDRIERILIDIQARLKRIETQMRKEPDETL